MVGIEATKNFLEREKWIITGIWKAQGKEAYHETHFLSRVEKIQKEALRIGGIRSGYRLDQTIEPFFKDLDTPVAPNDPRDMAGNHTRGIVIDTSTKTISLDESNVFTVIDLRDLNYAIKYKDEHLELGELFLENYSYTPILFSRAYKSIIITYAFNKRINF